MISLILAIVAALVLLEVGGFVLALVVAAFGRWMEDRDYGRAARWWQTLTADEQTYWQERVGPASARGILRAWDAHRAEQ